MIIRSAIQTGSYMKYSQVFSSAILTLASVFAQTTPGTIQGMVRTASGVPIPGVVISYSRVTRLTGPAARARPAAGEAIVRSSVSSDIDGGFAVPNLPAGDYLLCAEVPSAAYLNPCKWSASPSVTLGSGAVQRPALVLQKGVFLKVKVNDPQGLLPTVKNDPSHADNLIVGVIFGNGAFLAADLTRADRGGREYQMAIPTGAPLRLWIFSRHVTLTDTAGSTVDNSGGRIPFQAIAGRDQEFDLRVSGRDPRPAQEQ